MYKRPQVVFFAAILIAFAGFFPTYFSRLGEAPLRHHVHGGFASAWLLLLFVQGTLASRGRFEWHRPLGRLSPLIAVGVVLSATAVQRMVIETDLERDLILYSKLYFMDWVLISFFAAIFVAGIVKRRDVAVHQRCMMLTLVPLMPPALGRAVAFYGTLPMGRGFAAMFHPTMMLVVAALVGAILDDRRRGRVYWPYPVGLAVFLFAYLGSLAVPSSEALMAFLRWTAL